MQAPDVRIVEVSRAAARLQQEERVGVQRGGVQIVRIPCGDLAHRVRVRAILLHARVRVEVLDVAHRQRVDEVPLPGAGMPRREPQRLLDGGVGPGRLVGAHRPVQIRAPRPSFAPVADRTVRIVLLRLPEGAGGILLGERVHQLEALIEVLPGLGAGRGDRAGEGSERRRVERDRLVEALGKRRLRRLLARGRVRDRQRDDDGAPRPDG